MQTLPRDIPLFFEGGEAWKNSFLRRNRGGDGERASVIVREFIIDDARYTRKIEEKYIEINRLEEIETGRETLFLTIEHAVTSCSIVIVNPYEEGGEHVRFDNARKRKIAGRSIIRLVLNQEQSRRFISGRSNPTKRNETKLYCVLFSTCYQLGHNWPR